MFGSVLWKTITAKPKNINIYLRYFGQVSARSIRDLRACSSDSFSTDSIVTVRMGKSKSAK